MPPDSARVRLCLCLLLTAAASPAAASPQVPGAPQQQPVALVGGVIHPLSGPEIRDGVLVFDRGKIVAVGRDVSIPDNARRIELDGRHVYPGLFDAHTDLGLVEISAVRATVDTSETGQINPNVRAHVAFNADSELLPVTRSNGVLTVLSVPSGGLISGTSAVMLLDGWTWEDMALKPGAGVHVVWPRMAPVYTWALEESGTAQLDSRDKALEQMRRALADARAYLTARRARAQQGLPPPDHDLRWEAMIPLLEGRMPLVVEADEIQQIQSAVALARQEGLKLIISGGYDAPACADLLKEHDVPVIVRGVNRLPRRRHDPYDTPFTVPSRLFEAGIKFCISAREKMANVRNLPYHAATAVAYGLPYDEALRAITLYPARILGVDDRCGSLEAGKDATLIITTGDPLEIPTHVTQAFIQGREVDLSNRQTLLWQKYQEKYRRLQQDPGP